MVERSESNPSSTEEKKWLIAATKFKFLGISPVSLFKYLCNLYPKDFREDFQDEMIESFNLLLGERLEKRPRSVPFYLFSEYKGVVTSNIAMRFQKIEIPWFR